MEEHEFLARRFEELRGHLLDVATRMLGSRREADAAVAEARRRLFAADGELGDPAGWLTTVVGRVCLEELRRRRERRADLPPGEAPAPAAAPATPAQQGRLADSVGIALFVVLETLDPTERLAFVLHDLFAVEYEEIAGMLDRTPAAVRELAARARRRVQGGTPTPDIARHRRVVDAFLTAAKGGDLHALVDVLAPDVVARSDADPVHQGTPVVVRGAEAVAKGAAAFAQAARAAQPALVNGSPGVVAAQAGEDYRVMAFEIAGEKIVDIEVIIDPARLSRLDLALLD
ncbi:sigma-70 family RNA polymerase sigma factor [Streptomyces sp. NPDC089919]|uniref:sigma-70 family RNA polymerase sigma factor n=1 Tax=Streptomyces sp. NPDC089919 TaxID=3155188 RepID=UPI00341C6665